MQPRTIVGTCLALLVGVAAISTVVLLASGLACRGMIDLIAAAAFPADDFRVEHWLSSARLLKASGACGLVAGLVACGRLLLDLRNHSWL